MRQKKFLFASAAVLLFLLLVVPQVQLAGAKGDPTGKMSAELVKQLSAAKPDETVTAVVKMSAVANLNGVQGVRGPVFAELRRTASMSQTGLVNYLNAPTVQNRVSMVRPFWIDNIVLVKATKDVIEALAARDDVLEVFDNFTLTLPPRPEKTDGPERSSLQVPLWDSLAKIGAPQVWTTYGLAGAGVRVGGLDTGVDITHPDIAGKMITNNPADPTYPGGWAEFDANGNIVAGSVPHDSDQHGTHTTGTMIGGNASGYHIGVAPDANLIHGLVIPGGSGTFTQVVGGMEWIIDPDNNPLTDDGAQVVNMSLGATGVYTEMVAPTDNMVAAGVFPSFSIGNSGPNPNTTGSPGNVPSAFGVGATDLNDVIGSFSSRGTVTWNFPPYVGTYTKPDISAPGVDIFSSIPGGSWAGDWSGTSMAAPHVSGTVALMLQANPSLTVDMIKQLLAQTALELGDPGMDNTYGWGRVNAYAAVSAALVGVGTLNGTVYSSGGGTVDHVLVRVVDTGQRVFTNALGQYTMQLVAGDHTIEYSKFGYQTSTVAVTIVANSTTTQDVTLTQLPSGTIAGFVTDSDTHQGVAAAITVRFGGSDVAWTSSDPMTGAYSIVLPVGTYDLVFSPGFPYPLTVRNNVQVLQGMTTTLDVALMGAQVLIVDDDAGKAYQTYYEQAVAASGRSSITVTTPPTAAEMAMFESVVWLTGDDYTTTLSSADQLELAAYLDGGGRLFMSGQDIGYDINTAPFYADYLHADYVQDDVKLGGVIGDASSAVGQGFTFNIKAGDGANNQTYPSEIDPLSPAQAAFAYDPLVPEATGTAYKMGAGEIGANGITSSGTAGLTVDAGAYKIVYFAFGFEAIDNAAARGAVMTRVLDWLQGYPEITHTPLGDTEDTENPYEVKALITSDYFALDPATFAVVYDMGGPLFTVPMVATGAPDEYAGNIPAQPIDTQVNYYITASDMVGHTTTDPLGAPATKHSFWVKQDQEAPAVVHQPHRNTNDLEGPYTICAMVTDNIGVESVYLMYAKDGGLVHRAKMMPMGGDQYCGAIPGPSMVGDYYEYYIYAMDESYSGNVTRMPETGAYRFEIVEEFVWDFEPDDGGFVQTGDVWQWGAPTSGPGAAHSGVNLWATILAGNYPSSANAKLDVPAVTLAASKPYVLFSFWHWYRTEASYDGGNIKVSSNGGSTWTIVEPFGGYDGTASTANAGIPGERCFIGANNEFWQQELFDLSAYAGQTVMIRFHFGSDGSVNYPGWYVDDVRLRSTDVDDIPPVITGVQAPVSTFDTVGPYAVSCYVTDPLSGVGTVSALYSTDNGMTFSEIAMAPGVNPNQWVASIPGLPAGTRAKLYIRATDTASVPNVTVSPDGAPAATYGFSILPSAPILVVQNASGSTSLDMFRAALEVYGHQADYWNASTQGWLNASKLALYKTVILDETSGLDANEQADLTTFLNSGTAGMRKQFFILGRDLMYNSSTRPWIEQYMRAAYVQDDPAWRQITGEPGDPIGAEETFTISGSYPDELQRSTMYPGGEIVYRYTGPGTASSETRDELAGAYEKDGKEWDGVMPHAPISLDATAAMKYAGEKYRSVYFAFNLFYVLEPQRRADITHRVLAWLSAPEIVHTALKDTENATSPYVAVAKIYSETLDASRVKLTYDVGAGQVVLTMTPNGNPDEFSASIPAQPYGTTVHYYLSAANLDGTTSYHPKGAPTEQHTFVVNADMVPPEIVHTPYSNTTDVVGPYAITATITDNIAVDPSGVFLTYNKNSGTNTTIPMVALGGDAYGADIPGPAVLGDVFNYYIRARDTAAVPNEARDPAVGFHSFQIVDYYAWDFEASNGGFTATGTDWEWGDPTTGPMDAHSGVNVWATKLAANYSASSNSKLDLPPVTVPDSNPYALLSFWQWYANETNYDGGNVKISTNGGATWTILTPDIGYNGTAGSTNAGIPGEKCFTGTTTGNFWRKATFNLTPYKGQTVMLRLHFGSDSSVQYPGWYVDDVRIESVDDTEGPVFVSTTPPASTFDTVGPYTVKTVVTDPLSGVSTVTLYYSTNGGASWTTVAMAPTANPNEYSGGIPGQPLRTRIRLYVEATDNATNTSKDPATAPAAWYEFGIMPSGDYLVLRIGSSSTPAQTFIDAFTAMGRTADIWSVDTSGMPSLAILQAYLAVIVDNSTSFTTAQMTALSAFLDASVGHKNRIVIMGRDLQYYTADRTFMEKYTGTVYVKDDPNFRRLRSMPGDPIGAGESFVISGSYPDEVKLSTTYPGASIIYKYSALSAADDAFSTEQDAREFFQKEGKEWNPKFWPMAPSGPDSIAASRYVGTTYASVYFTFNFNYIQEAARRAGILQRGLDWLASTSLMGEDIALQQSTPLVPDVLVLGQNYPNPFNPVTRIQIGIPASYAGRVELKVYNVQGQLVKTVFEGTKPAGFHTFEWDGTSNYGTPVSSGIYFARCQAGQSVLTRKMVFLK